MKIKVIGKAHLKGTSKRTGSDYDFIQLHYVGKDARVEGDAALTINMDPGMFPYDQIIPGGEYNIEYGPTGRGIGIVSCLPVTKG